MEEIRNSYKILVGKREGLGRPRSSWDDNIRMDLGGKGWMHLAQDRDKWWAVVNTVMNFRFHKRRGMS
jgi:hypothetical protein